MHLPPTAFGKELGPGKAVRYQSELIATKKLKNGSADFSIGLSDGDNLYTMRSFQLRTNTRGSDNTDNSINTLGATFLIIVVPSCCNCLL